VKLEEIKAQRKDRNEGSIRVLINRLDEFDKEDARRARENGWCDDSLSDKLAAEIYHEKTCPWRRKPDCRNEPSG
jgi:hypothetical protein